MTLGYRNIPLIAGLVALGALGCSAETGGSRGEIGSDDECAARTTEGACTADGACDWHDVTIAIFPPVPHCVPHREEVPACESLVDEAECVARTDCGWSDVVIAIYPPPPNCYSTIGDPISGSDDPTTGGSGGDPTAGGDDVGDPTFGSGGSHDASFVTSGGGGSALAR